MLTVVAKLHLWLYTRPKHTFDQFSVSNHLFYVFYPFYPSQIYISLIFLSQIIYPHPAGFIRGRSSSRCSSSSGNSRQDEEEGLNIRRTTSKVKIGKKTSSANLSTLEKEEKKSRTPPSAILRRLSKVTV